MKNSLRRSVRSDRSCGCIKRLTLAALLAQAALCSAFPVNRVNSILCSAISAYLHLRSCKRVLMLMLGSLLARVAVRVTADAKSAVASTTTGGNRWHGGVFAKTSTRAMVQVLLKTLSLAGLHTTLCSESVGDSDAQGIAAVSETRSRHGASHGTGIANFGVCAK
eukprot:4363944-Pleurochrysis_carterae.AAC.1